jgi:hypothetical protein
MPLETKRVDLHDFQGYVEYGSDLEQDPRLLSNVNNVEVDEQGMIRKRRGITESDLDFGAGPINLLANFESQAGFESPTDRRRAIVISGTVLYIVKNWGGFPGLTGTIQATFSVTNALHYTAVANNSVMYLTSENGGASPKLLAYVNSTWVFRSAELDGPAAAPTVAVGAGTGLTGSYQAQYTYQDIWGNESNPSPESSAVSLTNDTLDIAVIASADPTISFMNVYVLSPGTSLYRFSGTKSNTNGTYSHTISDATLSRNAEAPSDNFPAPKAKYCCIYNDMLMLAGDPTLPDLVYFSNAGFHREFGAANYARAASGDGQPIKGFGRVFDALVIGKADSLHLGEGADETVFRTRPHNEDYGVLGQPSMSFFGARLAFFSDDGIYVDDSLQPSEISERIRNKIRTLNSGNLNATPPKQFSATYKYYKQIFFAVREASSAGENDTILVWNYERNTWTRWTGISARYLAAISDANDYELLYGGDASGNVFRFEPPNVSFNRDIIGGSTVPISMSFETPWLNFAKLVDANSWDRQRTVSRHIRIYASGEPGNDPFVTLRVNYLLDLNTKIQGTFSLTFSATTWPAQAISDRTVTIGAKHGTIKWLKLRFSNDKIGEHVAIHRIEWSGKLKPMSR